jgi:hypothetical protein
MVSIPICVGCLCSVQYSSPDSSVVGWFQFIFFLFFFFRHFAPLKYCSDTIIYKNFLDLDYVNKASFSYISRDKWFIYF